MLSNILRLSPLCTVDKKLPKTFFKTNFTLSSDDKQLLDNVTIIESIHWEASIKPKHTNIPAYYDNQCKYEEIPIISANLHPQSYETQKLKVAMLIQKHIPYPVLLCLLSPQEMCFHACTKLINHADPYKLSVQTAYHTQNISRNHPTPPQTDFLNSMAMEHLNKTNLKTCYESYIANIIALKAAQITDVFTPRTHHRSEADMQILLQIEKLEKDINSLKSKIKKESIFSLQMELNITIKTKEKEIQQLKQLLIVIY